MCVHACVSVSVQEKSVFSFINLCPLSLLDFFALGGVLGLLFDF